uniref:DUF2203 family protein n=1 Tax=Eiseniibacteriota bacterium TaxID=2212470 RepID=A0A832MMQ7_UNCEI
MPHPVRITLFGVEDANRVAAEIRPELVRLARVKREFDQLQSRIAVQSVAVAGASPENPDVRDLKALVDRRDLLAGEITMGVQAVQRRGCLLKDLDRGLVDFYALSGDRLVFLCWHMGEAEVAHWHTLESGFAGRQPLQGSELE